MKISVVMIAKNEEALIWKALASVKDADEIILCDTGSTDRTIEIAKQLPQVRVVYWPWNDDFSAARNCANSFASGDFCLALDCDHTLDNSMDEVRREAIKTQELGHKSAFVRAGTSHWMAVLFKNHCGIHWKGRCHEVISLVTKHKTTLSMTIGSSPNHALDPERNLRILLKDERTPRTLFYLGRTCWEMKDYAEAVHWIEEYLQVGTWLPERAEAYYVLANCYWQLQLGDKARNACLKCLEINANMKKAVLLFAEMSWWHNAKTWRKFAEHCTNEDVLFT